MRLILFTSIILFAGLLSSCQKDNNTMVYGTVKEQGGCLPYSWRVEIENPEPARHSFICSTPTTSSTVYSCAYSVFVVNLPESFKVAGKRIKFSKWTDEASCFSSSFAPGQIYIKDLSSN